MWSHKDTPAKPPKNDKRQGQLPIEGMLSAPKQPSSILSTGCEVVNFHGDYLLIEYASSSERSQEPVE